MNKGAKEDSSAKGKIVAKPLFVMGSARSGTTLLQRILNSYEGVYVWGEHGGFLKSIVKSYNSFKAKDVVLHLKSLKVEKGKNFNAYGTIKDPSVWSGWSNQFNREDVKKIYRDFMRSFFWVNVADLRFYGFKEVRYGCGERQDLSYPCPEASSDGIFNFLKEIFPESKYIFIVRDPVEVIASTISHLKKNDKSQIDQLAALWATQNRNILDFYSRNKEDCFLMKYEELIDKSKTVLADLSSFLGLQLGAKQYSVLDLESGRGADPKRENRKSMFTGDEVSRIIAVAEKTTKGLNEDFFLQQRVRGLCGILERVIAVASEAHART